MGNKFVYVCQSECKGVVKVGISYNVGSRITGLKAEEKQNYKVLFCSKSIPNDKALEIEKQVTNQFKDDILKGKEWYCTKPLIIIEFLINDLGLEPFEIGEVITEFESWEENITDHRSYKESLENPHIKEKKAKGLYSISYIDKDEFKYMGFCNYGDAKNFYTANKEFVLMTDNIIEDLYGINKQSFQYLQISPKRNIYSLREEILKAKVNLLNLLELTNL